MKKILFCLFLGISLLVNVVLSIFVECKEQRKIPINRYICGCRKPVLLQIYFKLN